MQKIPADPRDTPMGRRGFVCSKGWKFLQKKKKNPHIMPPQKGHLPLGSGEVLAWQAGQTPPIPAMGAACCGG